MKKETTEVSPEPAKPEGGKRRRRYSAEEKARLLAECEAPGSSVSLTSSRTRYTYEELPKELKSVRPIIAQDVWLFGSKQRQSLSIRIGAPHRVADGKDWYTAFE